jgi:hypothetical protein
MFAIELKNPRITNRPSYYLFIDQSKSDVTTPQRAKARVLVLVGVLPSFAWRGGGLNGTGHDLYCDGNLDGASCN